MKHPVFIPAVLFVILIIVFAIAAPSLQKASDERYATHEPVPAQTSEAPKDEPSATPVASEPADADGADDEVDMSNYKVHKLPEDTDTWTDQEWEWWINAASDFQIDYKKVFEDHFGYTPDPDVVNTAQNFAEEVCRILDKGGNLDDIAEGVVDSGGTKQAQFALAMAVHPGVNNFCPWNDKKLDD